MSCFICNDSEKILVTCKACGCEICNECTKQVNNENFVCKHCFEVIESKNFEEIEQYIKENEIDNPSEFNVREEFLNALFNYYSLNE